MTIDEVMMQRCLQLAAMGAGYTAPNPMVGCVVLHHGLIVGEGFHERYGSAHAEVNAIEQVKDKTLLSECTVYVSLEPCAHTGKTPPCVDLLIHHKVKRVVVATVDPFVKVNGEGIKRLRDNGIEVSVGVLEKEAQQLNKYFFHFIEKKSPYVILKWAQTADKFIAPVAGEGPQHITRISNELAHMHAHKLRSEVAAIMVGTNTAVSDNPRLTVRHYFGHNPVRVVLDRSLRLQPSLALFDGDVSTIVFTEKEAKEKSGITYVTLPFDNMLLPAMLGHLYNMGISSLMVEGGTQLLQSFIDQDLWNEIVVYESPHTMGAGIRAPQLGIQPSLHSAIGNNCISNYFRD